METENNNYIFVIGGKDDVSNISDNLAIHDVFDVRDRSQKRLILSKLLLNNNKLLIESNFLKVVSLDLKKNKIILELDSESDKVFRLLDNKAIDLLGELLSENNEKMDGVELNMEGELTYVPLISDENSSINTLRLCLDSKTTLKYNKNSIELEQIKVGDMFRFLIEIESINLYPNELVCHLKVYCHMGEIYRTNTYKLNKRTPINNYTFSTDVESVFQKVVLEDQDISLIKTEVEPEDEKEHNNTLNNLENISEASESSESSNLRQSDNQQLNNEIINEKHPDTIPSENTSQTSKTSEPVINIINEVKPKRKYAARNSVNKQNLTTEKKATTRKKKTT